MTREQDDDAEGVDTRGGAEMAVGRELSVSQGVPLRPEDRQRLREAATVLGVGPGLLARAAILAALEGIDADGAVTDPRLSAALEAETEAERTRQSQAGQAAMRARWGDRGEADPSTIGGE